jgi:hypothetical protein
LWYICNASLFIAVTPLSSSPQGRTLHRRNAALFSAATPLSSLPRRRSLYPREASLFIAVTPLYSLPRRRTLHRRDSNLFVSATQLSKFWGGDWWKETGPHKVDGVIALSPTDWTIRDLPYLC